MEPQIIHEDDQIIVLNKPSGMIVHPVPGIENKAEESLSGWLAAHFPEVALVGEADTEGEEGTIRPGIVHRLDRDTSGVIVCARTAEAYNKLKEEFAEREIKKTYRAFVYGTITEERFSIDRPIGRGRGSGSSRSVRDAHGTLREAQTIFRTIQTGADGDTLATYLEAFPKTGRTHQIRVHLSFIHHPVICDPIYAPARPGLLGFSRLALHAFSLSFVHPATDKEVTFTAPLPPDFIEAEKRLKAGIPA